MYRILIKGAYEERANGKFPYVTSTVLAVLHTSSESKTEDEEDQ